ncbi:MAG: hypothetical protein JJT85_02770 [Chromatiales bacterium]|nr:hypothetical protein [Chromatiales bacterium]
MEHKDPPRPRYPALKARHRELRAQLAQPLALRTHRALSWLQRAEQEDHDHDARFIFLWISFNAAYANEIRLRRDFSERRQLLGFLNRLIDSDKTNLLYEMVWRRYPNSIRLLIDNHYVYQPFWDHLNGELDEDDWQQRFARNKASAHKALGRMDTRKIFAVTFDRLYTLRNQLVHGGATWNSSVNRSQVTDGASILGDIVPIVIHLMMENPGQLWGDPCYPVVE